MSGSRTLLSSQFLGAPSTVRRIHSESVRPFLFAASVNCLASAFVNRIGRILPLASSFGSFGLPGLRFFWVTTSESRENFALPQLNILYYKIRRSVKSFLDAWYEARPFSIAAVQAVPFLVTPLHCFLTAFSGSNSKGERS